MQLLEPPYRYLLVMVVTGLVLSLLGYYGYRAKSRRHGWRRIEPGPMHWFGVVLGGALVLLFLYIRLFVGSARADAEHQMNILTGLIVAFSAGVGVTAWTMIRVRQMAFEWRGSALAYSSRDGTRVSRDMEELVGLHRSLLGWLVLSFADGGTVKLDQNARGSLELVDSIAERRPDLLPPSS